MNFKFLVIGAFLIVFVGCIGSTLHYKKQAESTALLLKQSEQTQNAELTELLNQANKKAEQRRQQLKDVLNNAENKIWTYGRVPDDVAGVLNQRATSK